MEKEVENTNNFSVKNNQQNIIAKTCVLEFTSKKFSSPFKRYLFGLLLQLPLFQINLGIIARQQQHTIHKKNTSITKNSNFQNLLFNAVVLYTINLFATAVLVNYAFLVIKILFA